MIVRVGRGKLHLPCLLHGTWYRTPYQNPSWLVSDEGLSKKTIAATIFKSQNVVNIQNYLQYVSKIYIIVISKQRTPVVPSLAAIPLAITKTMGGMMSMFGSQTNLHDLFQNWWIITTSGRCGGTLKLELLRVAPVAARVEHSPLLSLHTMACTVKLENMVCEQGL